MESQKQFSSLLPMATGVFKEEEEIFQSPLFNNVAAPFWTVAPSSVRQVKLSPPHSLSIARST
jgi:hypothetical protein